MRGQAAHLWHRHHTAHGTERIGVARGAQWMERERREARRGPAPCQAPGAESTQMRILGNRGRPKKRGQGKRGGGGGGGFRSRSGNGRSPCRKEQRRGGAGKLPPGAAGPASLGAPAPLGLVALAGRSGPSSLLLHAASLAQRPAGPGPRQPPAWAPAFLAFPGGGVSYKGSCGSLERGARRPLLI